MSSKPIKNKEIEDLAIKAAKAWIEDDKITMEEIQNSEIINNMPLFAYQAFRSRVLSLCKGK